MVDGRTNLPGGLSTREYGNIDASFSDTPLFVGPSENEVRSNPHFVLSSPDRRQAGVMMMHGDPRTTKSKDGFSEVKSGKGGFRFCQIFALHAGSS